MFTFKCNYFVLLKDKIQNDTNHNNGKIRNHVYVMSAKNLSSCIIIQAVNWLEEKENYTIINRICVFKIYCSILVNIFQNY